MDDARTSQRPEQQVINARDNPLLQEWLTPFEAPPFEAIAPGHFRPAFEAALAEHRREIDAIAANSSTPTFANTMDALELSGRSLSRVSGVFFNLTGAHTSDELEAIELQLAPVLAEHRNAIYLDQKLYGRVHDLWRRRTELKLPREENRVLERYHTVFTRQGAGLAEDKRQRLAAISQRLATLGTTFGQNLLADEKAFALVLDGEADLDGLPDFLRDAAAKAAADRGFAGKHVITLARSSIEPFLQFSRRRDLREAAFRAWSRRGEMNEANDNRPIIAEMVALRAERAELLGFPSFAHFRLDDTMAGSPEAALGLLRSVWGPARKRALEESSALQELIQAEGGNFELAPWDWRHYSELRRKAEFDLDEGQIKPFLQLEHIIAAAFETASRLFGLSFHEQHDAPVYHPDVRVWEVRDEAGEHVGLFLGDYFARESKRSGAWMSSFRGQEKLAADIRPIVVNVMNFSKPGEDAPALLSFDDARTLFHEFGHALHGLLSNVTYPMLAGTGVSRDFVEFPSQLFEHWLEQPEVLKRHAVHCGTGEPMPESLLQRLLKARTFNQGFSTVEYLSSALVDFDFHLLRGADALDVDEFERASLERIDMPKAITMRHRPTHFQHIFAGDGYSAAYYSYLWSEVLDADGFRAFEEAGDIFDANTARRLRDFVYAAGNSREPAEAYVCFRGRMPDPQALLAKRGLADAPLQGEN